MHIRASEICLCGILLVSDYIVLCVEFSDRLGCTGDGGDRRLSPNNCRFRAVLGVRTP